MIAVETCEETCDRHWMHEITRFSGKVYTAIVLVNQRANSHKQNENSVRLLITLYTRHKGLDLFQKVGNPFLMDHFYLEREHAIYFSGGTLRRLDWSL